MQIKEDRDQGPDKISVIIVTYNAGATLQRCLDSVFAQTYPNIEVVIVDGQSTDNTVDILKRNESNLAFWKSEKDSGIYDAMNKALKYVKGQWIYFLGADDELLPDFSAFANELNDNNAIYYANVLHNDIVRSGKVSPYYMAKVGIYHQAIIYPASVFKYYNYSLKYPIAADYALNMQCFKDDRWHYIYKAFIVAKYNHTGISATVVDNAFEKDKPGLILKNFGLSIWARYVFRRLKAKLNISR